MSQKHFIIYFYLSIIEGINYFRKQFWHFKLPLTELNQARDIS